MTNEIAILIYCPFLIMGILFLGAGAHKKNKSYVDKLYILLCCELTGWLVLEMLFYLLPDPSGIEFVYSAKFIFIAFIPLIFLSLVAGFFHVERKVPRLAIIVFSALPAVIAAVAATSPLHDLFRQNFTVLSTAPLTQVAWEWGPWYIVTLIGSQLPIALIVWIFISQYRKLPANYRANVNLLLAALFIYIFGFAFEVFGLDGANTLDFNLIAICICNFIFYIAVAGNDRSDYLGIWRRDIFDYLDEAVLILNGQGTVMEANHAAIQMFHGIEEKIEGRKIDAVLRWGEAAGLLSIRDVKDNDNKFIGRDLYITTGKYPIIYSIQRLAIPGRTETERGEFIAFTDVTQNRLLIERMQDTAGIDTLTGLKNRFGYEQMLRTLDTPANLPLTIVFGDINGLKAVNDTHGHKTGDQLLKTAAKILRRHFPRDHIARIGGDEFVVLLPSCNEQDASRLVQNAQQEIAETTGFPFHLSIAFGSATKSNPEENINQLIGNADKRMYSQKEKLGVPKDG